MLQHISCTFVFLRASDVHKKRKTADNEKKNTAFAE